jgi:CTP:phosphocholine cytidylyltransferase-like protein
MNDTLTSRCATISTVREYNRIEDPGHSWLEVPIKDVREAGVEDQITPYSYIKDGKMYLEEDCDLDTFYNAMVKKGITIKMNRVMIEDSDEFFV